MYRATTRNIEVNVTPRFLPERSAPDTGYFFWAYTIEITNHGSETVQLKTRHWRITDANGKLQEVRGAGVVGEEPVLAPGESIPFQVDLYGETDCSNFLVAGSGYSF